MKKLLLSFFAVVLLYGCGIDGVHSEQSNLNKWTRSVKKPIIVKAIRSGDGHYNLTLTSSDDRVYYIEYTLMSLPDTLK